MSHVLHVFCTGDGLCGRLRGAQAWGACAGDRYLLFGSDAAAMKRDFLKFFSETDWQAHLRLQVRHVHPRVPSWYRPGPCLIATMQSGARVETPAR